MKVTDVWGVRAPAVFKYAKTIPCVNPDLIIGVELETENINPRVDYDALLVAQGFKAKQDGSLRGAALEFISGPTKSSQLIAALQDYFTLTGFTEANYSDRCSVHVHANCFDMEFEQIGSVALLYSVVEEILFEFVGGYRDSNIYCIPWNQCRAHYKLIDTFLSDPSTMLGGWNKYTALNLIPLSRMGTVEFRQMHGTCDMAKLTTWINIVGAIFNYAKRVPLKDLIQQIKSLNTTSHYEVFFNEVLAAQLPYNEVYSQKLEEGIVLAKYSLIGYNNKQKKKESKEIIGRMPNPGVGWLQEYNVAREQRAVNYGLARDVLLQQGRRQEVEIAHQAVQDTNDREENY